MQPPFPSSRSNELPHVRRLRGQFVKDIFITLSKVLRDRKTVAVLMKCTETFLPEIFFSSWVTRSELQSKGEHWTYCTCDAFIKLPCSRCFFMSCESAVAAELVMPLCDASI